MIPQILDHYDSRKKEIAKGRDLQTVVLVDYIQNCKECIDKLKAYAKEVGFKDAREEINFYKKATTKVMSEFIYYSRVLQYEGEFPFPSKNCQRKYVKAALKKIKLHKEKNSFLYKYHYRKMTYLDHTFFLKSNPQLDLFSVDLVSSYDPDFFTHHSFKLCQALSNIKLAEFFENEKIKLKPKPMENTDRSGLPNFSWSASKTDLVELVYALKISGAVNSGNIKTKDLVDGLSKIFGVELNNHYKTLVEIKNRSTKRTKFLEKLTNSMEMQLDYEDGL